MSSSKVHTNFYFRRLCVTLIWLWCVHVQGLHGEFNWYEPKGVCLLNKRFYAFVVEELLYLFHWIFLLDLWSAKKKKREWGRAYITNEPNEPTHSAVKNMSFWVLSGVQRKSIYFKMNNSFKMDSKFIFLTFYS